MALAQGECGKSAVCSRTPLKNASSSTAITRTVTNANCRGSVAPANVSLRCPLRMRNEVPLRRSAPGAGVVLVVRPIRFEGFAPHCPPNAEFRREMARMIILSLQRAPAPIRQPRSRYPGRRTSDSDPTIDCAPRATIPAETANPRAAAYPSSTRPFRRAPQRE